MIVRGDMNAKVGSEQDPLKEIAGGHGLGERNEWGDMLVEWCATHEQVTMNTLFQHHQPHLYTCKSPGDSVRNQIDYITINRRFRNSIHEVKGYPGYDRGSDHVPIVATLLWRWDWERWGRGKQLKTVYRFIVNKQCLQKKHSNS